MQCNDCSRRNCKGEISLQKAQACRFNKHNVYRERRIIDRITDAEIIALHKLRMKLS
jgi:hypothetical protein